MLYKICSIKNLINNIIGKKGKKKNYDYGSKYLNMQKSSFPACGLLNTALFFQIKNQDISLVIDTP